MMTVWVDNLNQMPEPPAQIMVDWLTQPKRLVRALERAYPDITLTVVKQQHEVISPEEARLLHTSDREALVREIILSYENQPLVTAKVVIPDKTYVKYQYAFDQLGSQPIGDTLLYTRDDVVRSAFEFAWTGQASDQPSWARRCVFEIAGYPLLIVETFIPPLRSYVPGD